MSSEHNIKIILKVLKNLFPDAGIILNYRTPWELLVAVILSAQCTDKMVNKITGVLFSKYRSFEDYVRAKPEEFEKDIHSAGFFRSKTKYILASAKIIHERFNGKVPREMDLLLTLPGVARKTANVVMGNAWGKVEGIAVDTHVKRLSRLWGLTKENDPVKIERDLMKMIPRDEWLRFTYRAIEYGRKYCTARKHDHKKCPLTKYLPH